MNNENIILTKLYSLFQHIITYFFISVRQCLYVEWRVEYKSFIPLSPRQKN